MKKLALAIAIPALSLAACGEDTAYEETGDALEERADAVEDVGDDRAAALEEAADEAADRINEVADEME